MGGREGSMGRDLIKVKNAGRCMKENGFDARNGRRVGEMEDTVDSS
jgi:hypothetical protein